MSILSNILCNQSFRRTSYKIKRYFMYKMNFSDEVTNKTMLNKHEIEDEQGKQNFIKKY